MTVFTKLGQLIAAPVDENGNPRAFSPQDFQVWMTEVERFLVGLGLGDLGPEDLPAYWAYATDAGAGTPNAIQATTPFPITEAVLVIMNIATTNGPGPTTVQFNGAGPVYTIKTNSGNDPVEGGLPEGMLVAGRVSGSTFRLVSDQASAAVLAQAEDLLEDMKVRFLGTFADDAAATTAAGTSVAGQLYFRTSDDTLRVYRSGVWTGAEGEQGIQGEQGVQGIQGPQGERDTRNFCWAGSFDWWRKGSSIASTAGRVLTADGWTIGRSGGVAGYTVSQQQGSRGSNLCARVQRNNGDTSTGACAFVFNLGLADSRPLASKTFVLTFRARAGASFSGSFAASVKSSNSLVEQAINLTNGNYSAGDNTVASSGPSLTTSWQTFTIAGAFPADLAQAALRFQHVPTGTAGAADYFEIEEVQLQLGAVATAFVPIDPTLSLVKAMEQFRTSYAPGVAPGTVSYLGALRTTSIGTGIATAAVFSVEIDPPMRATPTVVAYSPQTGASGMMAQGSAADRAAAISHLGASGFGLANSVGTVASELHYAHWTAEARL
ncbi:MAG TPA: hypothetical protein VFZ12_09080 [Dehalococcoidia bacterium]|nr:hypothetical protein [Dehalococcoidia bacterium]